MDIYKEIDKKVEKIVKDVFKYMSNLNIEYIRSEIFKAYEYTKIAHEWQKRLSWEPYLIHPVEATELLLKLKPDLFTIQACLLHDVIEDTTKTEDDIKEYFWGEVAFLCAWMEKLSKVKYRWEERNIWSLRKMFIAMAEDLRVVFIKLADRLHNMKTLSYHPTKEKRERIALETLNIYAPIADRLWLYKIKNALDRECFKILEHKKYLKLDRELKELKTEINIFTENAKKDIEKLFKWKIFDYEVDFRVKSIYSIHKKLVKKWLDSAKDLFDIFWIRIIVKDESDCYKALWIIHSKWTPLPNRFKDYIALPKPNWYKSLHTNVMWFFKSQRKQPTEIQIKTFKMKEYSDIWVAAHFEYKENGSRLSTEIGWVRDLKELVNSIWDNDFVWSLKVDVFKDRIYVFTPKWDFINLPAWSTPIDFAYYVHSDLWNHISLAKVNNSIYPLDKELHNGDVVEVIVDKNKKPNPFWISFVKTVKAKNRIKNYLKKEDKELHRERWKEVMNKYLEKAWLEPFDSDMSVLKNLDGVVYSKSDKLNLLEQIWNFSVNPASIIRKILKTLKIPVNKKETSKEENKEVKRSKIKDSNLDIIIWWELNIPYELWHCCKRKIPNEMVAHINSKWIFKIHKRNCKVLENVNKERLLSAYIKWDEEESVVFNVYLVFINKIWILKDLSNIIFSMWIDVDSISTNKIWNNKTMVHLELKIIDYDYLIIDRFIDRVKLKFKDLLSSSDIWKVKKNK